MKLTYTVLAQNGTRADAAFAYTADAVRYACDRGVGAKVKRNGLVVLKIRDREHLQKLYNFLDDAIQEIDDNYLAALKRREERYAGYVTKALLKQDTQRLAQAAIEQGKLEILVVRGGK